MALELKRNHRRLESSGSSISIFTFGPKSDSSKSSRSDDNEVYAGNNQLTGSMVTILARPSLESIPIQSRASLSKRSTFTKIKITEALTHSDCCKINNPITSSNCKCLIF